MEECAKYCKKAFRQGKVLYSVQQGETEGQ